MKTEVGCSAETRRETEKKENKRPNRLSRQPLLKLKHRRNRKKGNRGKIEGEREVTDLENLPEKKDPKKRVQYNSRKLFSHLQKQSKKQEREYRGKKKVSSLARAALMNWLLEIVRALSLQQETFFLSVDIVDKGLEETRETHFQLLGITALFMACKFEEVLPPPLSYFCFLCGNKFSPAEVIAKEAELLMLVNFRLVRVSPLSFLGFLCPSLGEENQRVAAMLSHLLVFHDRLSGVDCLRRSLFTCELALRLTGSHLDSSNDKVLGVKESEFFLCKTRQIVQALDKHQLTAVGKLFPKESVFLSAI